MCGRRRDSYRQKQVEDSGIAAKESISNIVKLTGEEEARDGLLEAG